MRDRNLNYATIVERFAREGATIIRADPRTRYHTIGKTTTRKLEPGFIPIEAPPRVLTVSYYPNETELNNPEFRAADAGLRTWGQNGDMASYECAYRDWLASLPPIPFHRDFVRSIFEPLGIADEEFAWLPLVKCPLPAKSIVPDDDVFIDKMILWDQLSLLRPPVIIAQGRKAFDVVGPMCAGKFPHRLIFQPIGRFGSKAFHEGNDNDTRQALKAAMQSESMQP